MPVKAAYNDSDDPDLSFPRLQTRKAQGCFLSFSVGQTMLRVNCELRHQIRERAGLKGDLWATIAWDEDERPWLAITNEPGDVEEDLATITDMDAMLRINSTALARLLCSRYADGEECTRLHYAYERKQDGPWTLFRLQEEEPEGWS